MKHATFTTISIFFALIICCATTIQTKAAPGDLDLTFGSGGKTYICEAVPIPTRVRVQPDGKIVTSASDYFFGESYISRHNADGTPDATFGNAPFGYVGLVYFNDYSGLSILVQDFVLLSDGKILAVGYWVPEPDNKHLSLFRFNSNGTLDNSFGTNGRVSFMDGGISYGDRIALQTDGKIIAAGRTASGFLLVRYNPNGTLDTGFGTNGSVIYGSNTVQYLYEVLLQSDGKIAIVGGLNSAMAIVRYNPNGTLDNGFGTNGVVNTDIAEWFFMGAALQTDSKIVVGGRTLIKRYNSSGTPDISFGTNGTIGVPELDDVRTLAVQHNGKIIAAGGKDGKFALSRYQSNGTIDTTFGTNGVVITTFLPNAQYDNIRVLAIQPDGKIIASGAVRNQYAGSGMARYFGDAVVANRTPFDFDGDGRADLAVFRPLDQIWYLNRSTQGVSTVQFGLSNDKITPADYDGDGKTDIAVFRNGVWWWINSSNGTVGVLQFGLPNDIPQPADFDGDGKSEIVVYRQSVGWYVYNLATNQYTFFEHWDLDIDIPVVGDYNGDGRADYAILSQNGQHQFWMIAGIGAIQWGLAGDKPVPADYDGDGKTDIAVFRPSEGNWYIRNSANGNAQIINWGLSTDIPALADYDGDGKADIAIFREGVWWIRQSTSGTATQQFGLATDKPVPAAYLP